MEPLSLEMLITAGKAGGASVLRCNSELSPAGGESAGIAPARYVSGSSPTYAYETRLVDGEAQVVVVVDGKASQLNRIEEQLAMAIADGNAGLSQMPRIQLTYPNLGVHHDYNLPHRAYDGHIRAGSIDGTPAAQSPAYIALRNATPSNARALLESSPISLALGAWDSTRKSHQARFRSPLVAEIIGVLADQSPGAERNPRRGGSRVDSISPSVQLDADAFREILEAQKDQLSPKRIEALEKEAAAAKKKPLSGSSLGLGSIPPVLDALGLVSCRRIIRHQVLSFAALRQLRFDSDVEGNAACRALLAALLINGMVRSNSELVLRANCDLVEDGPPEFWMDSRHGQGKFITVPTLDEADDLLSSAIEYAYKKAGIQWSGQILHVTGSAIIDASTEADDEGA